MEHCDLGADWFSCHVLIWDGKEFLIHRCGCEYENGALVKVCKLPKSDEQQEIVQQDAV